MDHKDGDKVRCAKFIGHKDFSSNLCYIDILLALPDKSITERTVFHTLIVFEY